MTTSKKLTRIVLILGIFSMSALTWLCWELGLQWGYVWIAGAIVVAWSALGVLASQFFHWCDRNAHLPEEQYWEDKE